MAKLETEGSERKIERLEAFIDAVLAIAITLPVVELHAPRVQGSGNLVAAYGALTPGYVAYGLSVVVIGLYWSYSHFSGKIFLKTDHVFNLMTVLFLALVSITPFPARPFAEHIGDQNARAAAVVYAAVLTAPSAMWSLRWLYARQAGLLDPHLAPDYLEKVTRKYLAVFALLLVGLVLTVWVDWRVGVAITALATLSHLIPPMAPQYKVGEGPRGHLQEPDERLEVDKARREKS